MTRRSDYSHIVTADDAVGYSTQFANSRASLWRTFADGEKEDLARRYEYLRDNMIAISDKRLKEFEQQWEKGYGYSGMMASVVDEMQRSL